MRLVSLKSLDRIVKISAEEKHIKKLLNYILYNIYCGCNKVHTKQGNKMSNGEHKSKSILQTLVENLHRRKKSLLFFFVSMQG